ncbi:hypothetical protein HP062_02150 [Pseudomonas sp. B14-6]|uniref:hypothetical protein n=1 Tax=Pseudomonas sp. B14-6 TaxID=2738843 RepID=UPI00155E774F|nr:hypothetical protein [Pseudomonas sp. B14-6]QKG64477.1 hypothetical protein HP062_02150 [Pseudomonas sp. B14-6]
MADFRLLRKATFDRILPVATVSYVPVSTGCGRQKPARSGQSDHPLFDIALLYWSNALSHMADQPKKARIIAAITAMVHVRLPSTTLSC